MKNTTSLSQVVCYVPLIAVWNDRGVDFIRACFLNVINDSTNNEQEEQPVLSWPIALLNLDAFLYWSSKLAPIPNRS